MSQVKYTIGIDFGTESGRAVLFEVSTGREIATAIHAYASGVIDEYLPIPSKRIRLDPDWALQDPDDYMQTLKIIVPAVLQQSGVAAEDIIGVGVDFTGSTVLPVKADGTPLCTLPEYRENPHAWVKLWKHHGCQAEADKISEIAHQMDQRWMLRYGDKVSSEWFLPKILEILNEAPEIYAAADCFIEAGDWLVWKLTGEVVRNSCAAGYKAIWSKSEGYPSDEFLKALDPRLEHFFDEKYSRKVTSVGDRAGSLTADAAAWTGLKVGTAVSVPTIDAHVGIPAATVVEPRRMAIIMGTSGCHMVLSNEEHVVPGICGYVEDGIVPHYFGYEAGQSCVGDHFAWFVRHCVPAAYQQEAEERGINLYQLLEEKAALLKPGESGLLALDWWNGNRCVLVDFDLSGMLIGATLTTKPEEIYRALMEATAFGTRVIVETFAAHNIPVDEIVACGGLPEKNKLLMQIYADVTGREFKIAAAKQTSALGAAMFGAVAAGKAAGGYDTIADAAHHMAHLKEETYTPVPENQKVYDRLYAEYLRLHDYFGRGENNVMKTLKQIKAESITAAKAGK